MQTSSCESTLVCLIWGHTVDEKNPACNEWEGEAMQTYVKTKNKVVDPTRSVAAVDTGMYLVGLNLFPALLGIL